MPCKPFVEYFDLSILQAILQADVRCPDLGSSQYLNVKQNYVVSEGYTIFFLKKDWK
jgi:hypothetical protein